MYVFFTFILSITANHWFYLQNPVTSVVLRIRQARRLQLPTVVTSVFAATVSPTVARPSVGPVSSQHNLILSSTFYVLFIVLLFELSKLMFVYLCPLNSFFYVYLIKQSNKTKMIFYVCFNPPFFLCILILTFSLLWFTACSYLCFSVFSYLTNIYIINILCFV